MVRRRLIICCDGTQNDGINTPKPPTNVIKIVECVHSEDERNTVNDDGIIAPVQQLVYYQAGVGTGTSQVTNAYDSIMGKGIENNIREAYNYLCSNYRNEKDEIVLIGFSRGAFTVRALAFLINQVGLLKKEGLRFCHKVFKAWSKQRCKNADNNNVLDTIIKEVEWLGLRNYPVGIKACAVWDTVAALRRGRLEFVDETIPACVERAIHALALNEERSQFEPLLFDCPKEDQTLKQCWFLGSHSDVGGGNRQSGLANISLAWMMAQLEDLIYFDPSTMKKITSHWNPDFSSGVIKAGFLHGSTTDQPPMFELEVKIPVRKFQAKNDVQVGTFAKFQRLTGWKYRKPFNAKLKTEQSLHWTVPILLEKQCVRTCVPLHEFDYTTQISEAGEFPGASQDNPSLPRGDKIAVRLKREPRSLFEERVLADWIIEEILQAMCKATRSDREDKDATIDAVKMIPIYAVLWEPGLWSIEESKNLGKQIYLGFRHGSQVIFQTPDHEAVIGNWRHTEERSMSAGIDGFVTAEWHKTCKVLTGRIDVPVADTRVPSKDTIQRTQTPPAEADRL